MCSHLNVACALSSKILQERIWSMDVVNTTSMDQREFPRLIGYCHQSFRNYQQLLQRERSIGNAVRQALKTWGRLNIHDTANMNVVHVCPYRPWRWSRFQGDVTPPQICEGLRDVKVPVAMLHVFSWINSNPFSDRLYSSFNKPFFETKPVKNDLHRTLFFQGAWLYKNFTRWTACLKVAMFMSTPAIF